jgi:hypothetical protein
MHVLDDLIDMRRRDLAVRGGRDGLLLCFALLLIGFEFNEGT